jgi:hypothetical protein
MQERKEYKNPMNHRHGRHSKRWKPYNARLCKILLIILIIIIKKSIHKAVPALPAGEQRARVVPGNTRDTAHTHTHAGTPADTPHTMEKKENGGGNNGDQKTRDIFFWKKK